MRALTAPYLLTFFESKTKDVDASHEHYGALLDYFQELSAAEEEGIKEQHADAMKTVGVVAAARQGGGQ